MRLSALPLPARVSIGLLALHAILSLGALVALSVREGMPHSYIWLQVGGFGLISAICALGLARGARWAWWVAVITWGHRAIILGLGLASMTMGPAIDATSHGSMGPYAGAWFAAHVLVLILLLQRSTRSAYVRSGPAVTAAADASR